MSNEAPFDGQSPEALKALEHLASVTVLCTDLYPCRKDGCKRCIRRDPAWQNAMERTDMERTDMELENALWED